ncbi:MAG: extracellular solute-binding protein [Anaerolineae bacterium]|nr:extracellular solute-binding protein [Anaerolineae bacterium]
MFKRMTILATLVALLIGAIGVTAPAAAQDEVKLRLWAHQEGPFNDSMQALIDAYTAEHPTVSIEMETFEYELYLQTLQTSMPAGDEADIIELFGSWTCSYADRLVPAPVEIDRSLFFDATMNGYVCDDQVLGLPFEFNLEYGAVLANKAMFEAAGLAFPPAWEDWDALVSDAQALVQITDGQMTVAGYHFTNADAIAFSFLSGILQRGGNFWNEDQMGFVFDSEEAIATLQQMKDLVDAGVVDPVLFNDSANWSGDAFFTDQVALALIGPWAVAYGLDSFPEFGEFDYVALPSIGNEPRFAADSGWGLVVSENSPAADVAWDFVQFATSQPENALLFNTTTGTIPALRALVEDADYNTQLLAATPALKAVLPLLPYGEYIGPMPDRDLLFYDIIYPNILDMLQGLLSVEDAAAYINEDANASFE